MPIDHTIRIKCTLRVNRMSKLSALDRLIYHLIGVFGVCSSDGKVRCGRLKVSLTRAAKELGINRQTLDKAVKRLVIAGLIVYKKTEWGHVIDSELDNRYAEMPYGILASDKLRPVDKLILIELAAGQRDDDGRFYSSLLSYKNISEKLWVKEHYVRDRVTNMLKLRFESVTGEAVGILSTIRCGTKKPSLKSVNRYGVRLPLVFVGTMQQMHQLVSEKSSHDLRVDITTPKNDLRVDTGSIKEGTVVVPPQLATLVTKELLGSPGSMPTTTPEEKTSSFLNPSNMEVIKMTQERSLQLFSDAPDSVKLHRIKQYYTQITNGKILQPEERVDPYWVWIESLQPKDYMAEAVKTFRTALGTKGYPTTDADITGTSGKTPVQLIERLLTAIKKVVDGEDVLKIGQPDEGAIPRTPRSQLISFLQWVPYKWLEMQTHLIGYKLVQNAVNPNLYTLCLPKGLDWKNSPMEHIQSMSYTSKHLFIRGCPWAPRHVIDLSVEIDTYLDGLCGERSEVYTTQCQQTNFSVCADEMYILADECTAFMIVALSTKLDSATEVLDHLFITQRSEEYKIAITGIVNRVYKNVRKDKFPVVPVEKVIEPEVSSPAVIEAVPVSSGFNAESLETPTFYDRMTRIAAQKDADARPKTVVVDKSWADEMRGRFNKHFGG